MTLAVLVIPLPTFLLDMFLAMNLASAIIPVADYDECQTAAGCLRISVLLLLMTLFRCR